MLHNTLVEFLLHLIDKNEFFFKEDNYWVTFCFKLNKKDGLINKAPKVVVTGSCEWIHFAFRIFVMDVILEVKVEYRVLQRKQGKQASGCYYGDF